MISDVTVARSASIRSSGRGETNSFNAVRVNGNAVSVERYSWDPAAAEFMLNNTERFERREKRWLPVGE